MWITGHRTWITWLVNYLTPILTRWKTWWVQKLVDLGLWWKLEVISDFRVKGMLFGPRKKLFVVFCQVIHTKNENIWLRVTQKLWISWAWNLVGLQMNIILLIWTANMVYEDSNSSFLLAVKKWHFAVKNITYFPYFQHALGGNRIEIKTNGFLGLLVQTFV